MAFIDNFDLSQTATVSRRTWTSDGMGGGSYTNITVATIKCAVWQKTASEVIVSDRLHNKSTHTLACLPNASFLADDVITIGAATYKISKPDDIRGFGELMVIDLELTG